MLRARPSTFLAILFVALVLSAGIASAECTSDAQTLCLNDDRFAVQATFETDDGTTGAAKSVALTSDTGYFWFFTADNVEIVVKVLRGCALNNRYWVFAAGLTNVKVVLTVTDSETTQTKIYNNPQGQGFKPIQDVDAFASCPAT
jgi:hypothetical protein